MKLSKHAIKEFQAIYYKEFGERITDKEAEAMGHNLLSLFNIIYRPLPENPEQNADVNTSPSEKF